MLKPPGHLQDCLTGSNPVSKQKRRGLFSEVTRNPVVSPTEVKTISATLHQPGFHGAANYMSNMVKLSGSIMLLVFISVAGTGGLVRSEGRINSVKYKYL